MYFFMGNTEIMIRNTKKKVVFKDKNLILTQSKKKQCGWIFLKIIFLLNYEQKQ